MFNNFQHKQAIYIYIYIVPWMYEIYIVYVREEKHRIDRK